MNRHFVNINSAVDMFDVKLGVEVPWIHSPFSEGLRRFLSFEEKSKRPNTRKYELRNSFAILGHARKGGHVGCSAFGWDRQTDTIVLQQNALFTTRQR